MTASIPFEVLRTPDERFAALPGFSFEPRYVEVPSPFGEPGSTLRMHHVDEGPRDAPVVLLAHGEPTWSYLCFAILASIAASIRGARRFEERRVLKLTHALSPGTEMSS